jgi:tRNA G18 (ribose-2'-O)-methylase SpoU
VTPPLIAVDDPDDPRLRVFRLNERGLASRPQRRDAAGAGLFLAEGDLVVQRSLAAGCVPLAALVDAARPPAVTATLPEGTAVYAGGERVRTMVTGLGVAHGIVAVFHRPARPAAAELAAQCDRLVICEAVDNPANMGSIIRNAAALGWQGLVIDTSSTDPLARRSLRASMGHAAAFPFAREHDLPALLRLLDGLGYTIVALTPGADAVELAAVTVGRRMAIVIGSERAGLRPETMAAATVRAAIPMAAGIDSLNAAAATAIACYVLGR